MARMERKIDIHKAAGVLIKDGTFLITRTDGKDFFIAPGGKVEGGETVQGALIRELQEELGIGVDASDIQEFGTFYAPAAGSEDKYLQMDVFLVKKWQGEVAPASEVAEARWIDSRVPREITLGSIFLHDVLPKLKAENLIN
jgi:8-oxo-dGTP pyrophosphatase MutT (NUDIX family)